MIKLKSLLHFIFCLINIVFLLNILQYLFPFNRLNVCTQEIYQDACIYFVLKNDLTPMIENQLKNNPITENIELYNNIQNKKNN